MLFVQRFLYSALFLSSFFTCQSEKKVSKDELNPLTEVQATAADSSSSEATIQEDKGLKWLESIFKCPDGEGFCLPDEEKILTERFWEFVRESNEVIANPYGLTEAEQQKAAKEYQEKWAETYPLYKEETWPFGRGNGGEVQLKNMKADADGKDKYTVTIDFTDTFTTVNTVTLIPDGDSYLIDYIDTRYHEKKFESEKADGSMEFTQQWTWIYKNGDVSKGEFGHEGKMTAYYNPDTSYWLMTKDTYGISGQMFAWIIGKPDRSYLFMGISAHPEEENLVETTTGNWEKVTETPRYIEKTGDTQSYNLTHSIMDTMVAQEYDFVGTSMAESQKQYLKEMEDIDFKPLYHLGSSFSGEPRLPYGFPEGLPNNHLVLEEVVTPAGGKGESYIRLESIKDTLITIDAAL